MKLSHTVLASIALFSSVHSAIVTKIDTKVVTVVLDPVIVTVQAGQQDNAAAAPAPTTTSSYTTRNRRKPWVFTSTIDGQEVVFSSFVSTITPKAAPTIQASAPAPAPPAPTTSSQAPAPAPTTTEQPTPVVPTTSSEAAAAPTTTASPSTPSTNSPTVEATTATSTEPQLTTPSTSSISNNFGDVRDVNFSQQILDAHNQKRALHGVSALTWEQAAYDYAQAYADKYDCSGNLVHSGGPYGENLAAGYPDGPSAVNAWYNEGINYNYGSETDYDHFTAVIWKSTTKLGCAYKDCSAENWGKYIICSYDPVGNVLGEMSENVLPPVN